MQPLHLEVLLKNMVLELIAEDIQEMEANFTSFWVLGAEGVAIPCKHKRENDFVLDLTGQPSRCPL